MATPEEKFEKLETRFSTLEQQFATTMAKVDSLAEEAKQQREDIRRLNEKIDSTTARIDSKFNSLTNCRNGFSLAYYKPVQSRLHQTNPMKVLVANCAAHEWDELKQVPHRR